MRREAGLEEQDPAAEIRAGVVVGCDLVAADEPGPVKSDLDAVLGDAADRSGPGHRVPVDQHDDRAVGHDAGLLVAGHDVARDRHGDIASVSVEWWIANLGTDDVPVLGIYARDR